MKKWFREKIFSSNKNTLLFISLACLFVLTTLQVSLLCFGSYFNSNSDDVVQYTPILLQYINYFKEGKLGWFNFTNNLGASVFADAYYVPLDIFTLFTFLLSFIMDGIIAFSIVNLSKVLLGVVLFAYFLQRKGIKNWIVLFLSILYFSVGGSWVFSTYCTYFSLFFYLPLSLLVVDYYVKGKRWLLPLYGVALIFYNFYNAYTLFIFMLFVYVVVMIRDNYTGIKKIVKDVVVFGLHIVLSVVMGMFILLPSVLYILNYSTRVSSDVEYVFDYFVYFKMLYKVFVYEAGVDTFVFGIGDYIHQQFNYYLGSLSLFLIILMFFMKDRASKIYKWSLVVVGVMMLLPVFSMIFSGVTVAYTRWFSFINIILIYYVGHVLNNYSLEGIDKKTKNKASIIALSLFLLTVVGNVFLIFINLNSDYQTFYVAVNSLIVLMIYGILFILFFIFYFVKKTELMYGLFFAEMVIACFFNIRTSFSTEYITDIVHQKNEINEVLEKLVDIEDDELSRVYVGDSFKSLSNLNRFTYLNTNDSTFHSFMNKHIYYYFALAGYKERGLYSNSLNRYTPYNSKAMDYKYIILEKELYDFRLDYLEVYYEDDKYLIYENKYYEPFTVYESYYSEDQVIEYEEENVLNFEKNLFKGVILSEDNFNLNKIDYILNESNFKKVNGYSDANKEKISDNVYKIDLSNYMKYGYEGSIYLKGEQIQNISSVNVVGKTGANVCERLSEIYKCNFDKNTEFVEVNVVADIDDLTYSVVVNDENDKMMILPIEYGYEKYFNFYTNGVLNVTLSNGNDERICLEGICTVDDFEFDHILYYVNDQFILSDDIEVELWYHFDDLNYYFENVEDNNATNKSLTYDGSTINVKYDRTSDSSYDQIVVLPVSYSEEWICNNEDYELVRVNGGYLGVLVKNGIDNVDISITFKPSGLKIGFVCSIAGFAIYGVYVGFIIYNKKKREKNEII